MSHGAPCRKVLSGDHQDLEDVKAHCKQYTHGKNFEDWKKKSIKQFPNCFSLTKHEKTVVDSEVEVVSFPNQYNLSLARTNFSRPLLRNLFYNNKVVVAYACRRTKTSVVSVETLSSFYK